jgi:hypothetical protein
MVSEADDWLLQISVRPTPKALWKNVEYYLKPNMTLGPSLYKISIIGKKAYFFRPNVCVMEK